MFYTTSVLTQICAKLGNRIMNISKARNLRKAIYGNVFQITYKANIVIENIWLTNIDKK